jgi:hypothetical protein
MRAKQMPMLRLAALLLLAATCAGQAQAQSSAAPAADSGPAESDDWKGRVAADRARHSDWLACVAAKRRECATIGSVDPMENLLNDETLADGDIVSTPDGLKVFHGRPTGPHDRADFH